MKKAIKALGIGAVSAYALCTAVDEVLFNRKLTPSPKISRKVSACDTEHLGTYLEENLKWVENYGYERHFIVSDRGERLVGYFMKAKGESNRFVFCAHGYRSYAKKEFAAVIQYYLANGINVFMIDHVASGESEGKYCTFGFNEKKDCLKWLYYMNETFGSDIEIILHGVSMGGATVCMLSGDPNLPKNVKAVISDCGFSLATEFFSHKLSKMGIKGKVLVDLVNLTSKINHGIDFKKIAPIEEVKKAKLPFLFIHGEKDNLVPSYMARELYEACASDKKTLLIIENADHAQAYFKDKQKYESVLKEFLENI